MGMDRTTGRLLEGLGHVRQSAIDVLSTVRGERVMRLTYGSRLLESVDDAANPAGRARLLGRVADPLDQWEGDRLELRKVDVQMPEAGHVLVSVDGTTDHGPMQISDYDLTNDPRLSAYLIEYESPWVGLTTVGAVLDDALPRLHRLVVSEQIPPPFRYVAPKFDPYNAWGIRYGSRPVGAIVEEWIRLMGSTGVTVSVPQGPPSYPNPTPVYKPVPNAAGVEFEWPGAATSDLQFYLEQVEWLANGLSTALVVQHVGA